MLGLAAGYPTAANVCRYDGAGKGARLSSKVSLRARACKARQHGLQCSRDVLSPFLKRCDAHLLDPLGAPRAASKCILLRPYSHGIWCRQISVE